MTCLKVFWGAVGRLTGVSLLWTRRAMPCTAQLGGPLLKASPRASPPWSQTGVAFWDCPRSQIVHTTSAHARNKVLEFEFCGGQSENAYTRSEIAPVLDLYQTYSNWFVKWLWLNNKAINNGHMVLPTLSRRRGEQWMHAPVVGLPLPMITQHA